MVQYIDDGNVVETEPEDDTVTAVDTGGGGGGGGSDGGAGVGPFESAKGSITVPSHGSADFASSLCGALTVDLCRFASPYNKQ